MGSEIPCQFLIYQTYYEIKKTRVKFLRYCIPVLRSLLRSKRFYINRSSSSTLYCFFGQRIVERITIYLEQSRYYFYFVWVRYFYLCVLIEKKNRRTASVSSSEMKSILPRCKTAETVAIICFTTTCSTPRLENASIILSNALMSSSPSARKSPLERYRYYC